MEAIQQCYICKEWFDEKVLSTIKVPDQGGYVTKPICAGCLSKIRNASKAPQGEGSTGKPGLLMEKEQ